jgi:predicted O-methyltransferase YrrM
MSKLWYVARKPEELEATPWLAPKVVQYLENLIKPDWEIIEHGSGGSTLWFAQRAKCVRAFENNRKWREIVAKQAPTNAVVSDLPRGVAMGLPKVDMLLIDGEPVEDRRWWIEFSIEIVHPGGWVVLDNANRPEYTKERKHLQTYAAEVVTFDVNEGGTQYLVTEFYRMPEKGNE